MTLPIEFLGRLQLFFVCWLLGSSRGNTPQSLLDKQHLDVRCPCLWVVCSIELRVVERSRLYQRLPVLAKAWPVTEDYL